MKSGLALIICSVPFSPATHAGRALAQGDRLPALDPLHPLFAECARREWGDVPSFSAKGVCEEGSTDPLQPPSLDTRCAGCYIQHMHIVIDTETTGLPSSKYAAPISIGAVAIVDGQIVDKFTCFVLPTIINTVEYKEAEKIHGISLSVLAADALSPEGAVEMFRHWWNGLGKPMLYAFNEPFDSEMLRRIGFDPRGYWGPDIMREAAKRLGKQKVSLNTAMREFTTLRRDPTEPHNALMDARLAAHLAYKLGMFNA